MKRRRPPWILLALAAACALGLWLDRGRSTGDEVRLARRLLPGVALADIDAVEIGALRLGRAADAVWTLADGRHVDEQRLSGLLGALEFAHVERHLARDVASEQAYGLSPPKKQLRVSAAGKVYAIALGERDLSRRFVYVARAGERDVLLVEASLDEQSPLMAEEWVARTLVLEDLGVVHKLELGALALAPGRAPWVLAPRPGRAGARAGELVARLGRLRGERAVACDAAGPASGAAVALRGDGRVLVEVSPTPPPGRCRDESVWAKRADGACLCLPAEEWRTLAAAARDPWLHELTPLQLDDVRALTLDGARGFALRREEHRWLLTPPPPAKGELDADDAAVREWLAALLATRLDGAPHVDEPRPAAAVAARATLELRGEHDVVRLTLDGDRLQRAFSPSGDDHDVWTAPPALRAFFAVADARRLFRANARAVPDKVAAPSAHKESPP